MTQIILIIISIPLESLYHHHHRATNAIPKRLSPFPREQLQTPTQPPTQTLRYFNQCDSVYQSSSFGTCFKDGQDLAFLCAAGCVPTSVAEVIASYANSTPTDAASTLISRRQLDCNGSDMSHQQQFSGRLLFCN